MVEDNDFLIISPDVWKFFELHYGGYPIKRYGVREDENSIECVVEVNLQKIFAFDIPKEKRAPLAIETFLVPKTYTLNDLNKLVAKI